MTPKVTSASPYAIDIDSTKCENEPIHFISVIQHHAALIACNVVDFKITNVSKNLQEKIGFDYNTVIGKHLSEILDPSTFQLIETIKLKDGDYQRINPIRASYTVDHQLFQYNLIVHKNEHKLILELEPYDQHTSSSAYQFQLSNSIQRIQNEKEITTLFDTVANELKHITGYDRVMVYQFSEEGHGSVIAEAKEDDLEPYLGLHYPAGDIPAQARRLFLLNRVRLKADVDSESSPIHPAMDEETQLPLDLTYAVTRGVAPVHIEYLENMGVKATLSIAIAVDDKLWGLFACHNYSEKFIDYNTRITCGFIAQIFSGHLALHAANKYRQEILQANLIRSKLFEQMGRDWNMLEGLTGEEMNVMKLVDCSGACILTNGKITSIGNTPSDSAILDLVDWLEQQENSNIYETHHLVKVYEKASEFTDVAAGLLAVKFMPNTRNYVLWFRPEAPAEVNWAGDPGLSKEKEEGRIRPRKSFAKWSKIMHGTSRPWQQYELNAVRALINDIQDFITHKYNKVRLLNQELKEMNEVMEVFNKTMEQDFGIPLDSISSFAQLLLENHGQGMDENGKKVVNAIIHNTAQMNAFIQDIRQFAQLQNSNLMIKQLSVKEVAESVFDELLAKESEDRVIELKLMPNLPVVLADADLFKQLLSQLLCNAIKYTRNRSHAIIEIGGRKAKNATRFYIKDNGVGFDEKYADQVFGVFTRLVDEESYRGNGVGLAIAKKIIKLHKGKIHVESAPYEGTTFFVKLPGLAVEED